MTNHHETELVEHEEGAFEIIFWQEANGGWLVNVAVRGKSAGTTQIPFADKSEARNYGLAVGKAELAKFRKR